MYHPAGARQRDVSTRLIRPTLPSVDVSAVLELANNWDNKWEYDGSISVHDEGIAQYPLTNDQSHLKFYAALILNKPSLRCRLDPEEPEDVLDVKADNVLTLINIS
uniref:Rad60-SLD_2 domain-containing protein n=1 Tax=Steinernema glaseri TaxID=37863 RepID=A0A1I8APP9_9BILA